MWAGVASFIFSLFAFLYITELDEQVVASLVAGLFCLMVCYISSERPNSESARAMAALRDRLMAVEDGDLISPAPALVQRTLPKLAAAVDSLFTEVRTSIENAQALAMYDPVTSLPNRLHFRSEADKLLRRTTDEEQSAMLFVDLDRFKSVNDSLGHARGDQLLVMVANRLRVVLTAELRDNGGLRPLLARLAGDEFTLFFPQIASVPEIERVARRIIIAISEPFEMNGHSIDIGASIGIAIAPPHGKSIEALMRSADLAMYQAKSGGGGQHALFSEALADEHRVRVETERALGEALERNEFLLALQPQLSLLTGRVTGAEALLRWNHPSEGLRAPKSFIPIAERTGLIYDIGEWVSAEVAALLAASPAEGTLPRLAFNVSPRELDRPDYFRRLRQLFDEQRIPRAQIEIEFTESAVMECSDAVLNEITQLRAEGMSFAIDDFGNGYSNIARLRKIPFDRVKLDPLLIQDIVENEQARVVAQSVIQLIKGVGCEVVAEGVETFDQADILRVMGCDTVQGFVFAQPMFEDEFRAWISNAERGALLARSPNFRARSA